MPFGSELFIGSTGRGSPGTVDFYDTVTGQYLGAADLNPNDDGSGSATATWSGLAGTGYNLALGGHKVIAVYSGNDNFNGSQSSGTTVRGE